MYLFEVVTSDAHVVPKDLTEVGTLRLTDIYSWSDGGTILAIAIAWWSSTPFTFRICWAAGNGELGDHTVNVARMVEGSLIAILQQWEEMGRPGEYADGEEERIRIFGQVYVEGYARSRDGEIHGVGGVASFSLVELLVGPEAHSEEMYRWLRAYRAFFLHPVGEDEGRWFIPVDFSYRCPLIEWRGSYDGVLRGVDRNWRCSVMQLGV